MSHYKKTEPGFAERLELLCARWPEAPAAIEAALAALPRSKVARDDITDALVLAVTARLDWDHLETVPAQAERDQAGLPMAMVCPRATSA
jgi:predicted RNase H-like nuclease